MDLERRADTRSETQGDIDTDACGERGTLEMRRWMKLRLRWVERGLPRGLDSLK